MNWADVLQDKSLQDLPYKIETNEYGQIVMSPASNLHGLLQIELGHLFKNQKSSGRAISECSVETEAGVKVADVAWVSDEMFNEYRDKLSFGRSPEICVEIISPSNSRFEITQKMDLYFQHGAKEVWTCDLSGVVRFYTASGEQPRSTWFPNFPTQIDIQ